MDLIDDYIYSSALMFIHAFISKRLHLLTVSQILYKAWRRAEKSGELFFFTNLGLCSRNHCLSTYHPLLLCSDKVKAMHEAAQSSESKTLL